MAQSAVLVYIYIYIYIYILHTVNEGISQIPWRHGWQRHSGIAITCRARESSSNIWTRYPVRLSRLECFVSPAICISTCLNGSLWDPRHDFKWNRLFVPRPEISNSITRPGETPRQRLIDLYPELDGTRKGGNKFFPQDSATFSFKSTQVLILKVNVQFCTGARCTRSLLQFWWIEYLNLRLIRGP